MRTNRGFIVRFRKSATLKIWAAVMVCSFLAELIYPTAAWALTSGPAQEEFASFEPASTNNMVDAYTGDFTYNIPLMNIPGPNGGYPLNLAYHSGITMEQEASWVGLGWNLNVGAINRNLRGIPDDFNQEMYEYEYKIRPTWTFGLNLQNEDIEFYGFPKFWGAQDDETKSDYAFSINNRKGAAITRTVRFEKAKGKGVFGSKLDWLNLSLGLSFDSGEGVGINPGIGINTRIENINFGLRTSSAINNITGANLAFSSSITKVVNRQPRMGKAYSLSRGTHSISYSMGKFQAPPKVSIPTSSVGVNFEFLLGESELATTFSSEYDWYPFSQIGSSNIAFTGFYNISKIKDDNAIVKRRSNGFLYSINSGTGTQNDINRTHTTFSKKINYLNTSSFNYDIFSVTGQGLGGNFRAVRSDIPTLSDADNETVDKNYRGAFEYGSGTSINHLGLDLVIGTNKNKSGKWKSGTYTNHPGASANPNSEAIYFKFMGEQTGELLSETQAEKWQNDMALRQDLLKTGSGMHREYTNSLNYKNKVVSTGGVTASSSNSMNVNRIPRRKEITALTNGEAFNFGIPITYKNEQDQVTNKFPNSNSSRHLSEIKIKDESGSSYVYGLPVYNLAQVEVNTSVGVNDYVETTNPSHPIPSRVDVTDESYKDNNGFNITDRYYSKTKTPAYANSWLLTSVLSDDYIDMTNDGPTDDDRGYWVKFNYKKFHSNFKWRVPFQGANFNFGNFSDKLDNTAFYTYGEKEIFYIEEIESKTHIAKFHLSSRNDGYEAADEYANNTSGHGSKKLYKLDKIELFVKRDIELNGASAIPVQTVHFEYDYSLCTGLPNNSTGGGKLTLKRVYTTYLNNERGQNSPYSFDYNSFNPSYPGYANNFYAQHPTDRWGNYVDVNYTQYYPYHFFPYTPQDEVLVNGNYEYAKQVAPWELVGITLPTGGKITINYESDDYAFVEDKPAMQMFDIVGIGKNALDNMFNPDDELISSRDNEFYSVGNLNFSGVAQNNLDDFRVYVKLDRNVSATNGGTYVLQNLLKDVNEVWFKACVKLTPDFDNKNFEYITGYAPIIRDASKCGLINVTTTGTQPESYTLAYFTLSPVDLKSLVLQSNPIKKAALQYLKLSRSELLSNPMISQSQGAVLNSVTSLVGMAITQFHSSVSMLAGFYVWAAAQGYCSQIKLDGHSIVRLSEPDGKKYGGGVRVKSIYLNDQWSGSGDESKYGQEYYYDSNGDGTGKSTGVAYEPILAGEESPLKKSIPYQESVPLATAYELFQETPFMEDYYPGASVGYAKVTVKSVGAKEAGIAGVDIANTAAPYTVYEYYTPKDFPIYGDQTDMQADPRIRKFIPFVPGLITRGKIGMARSQGFSIVLNDMAGKLKSESTYRRFPQANSTDALIQKTEYFFHTQEDYNPSKRNKLSSKVQVLNPDGETYQTGVLGETFEMFNVAHEDRAEYKDVGGELNLEFLTALLLPVPVPLPTYNEDIKFFKTVVTHKIIHRIGILKEVRVTTDQSTISTRNLAFDRVTGDAILTETSNEFRDPIYVLNIPAHWHYERMGGSYKNSMMKLAGTTHISAPSSSRYTFLPGNIGKYLFEGDLVGVKSTGGVYSKVHVSDVKTTDDTFTLLNHDGTFYTSSISSDVASFTVLESGCRNLIAAGAGTVQAKKLTGFSLNETTTPQNYGLENIINSESVEYCDVWQIECYDCYETPIKNALPSEIVNPYAVGIYGKWRPKNSYAYVTNRNYVENIRTDGAYNTFNPFNWVYFPAGFPGPANNPNWTTASTITKYSPFGFEVENKDALGIYSAAHYGYGKALATAVAQNSRYTEMFYTGFEDYPWDCNESFIDSNTLSINDIEGNYVHSGSKSYKVPYNNMRYFTGGIGVRHECARDEDCQYRPMDGLFQVAPCNCMGSFTLKPGKKYVISAWAKEGTDINKITYAVPEIEVELTGGGSPVSFNFNTSGHIIEGWQRIYGEFEVPSSGYDKVTVKLKSMAQEHVFFDDLRIHPFNANMVTYVYNPITLKLDAQLDNNNYATFYVYDFEGMINKVKKETERGVMTLQEGRSSKFITNP